MDQQSLAFEPCPCFANCLRDAAVIAGISAYRHSDEPTDIKGLMLRPGDKSSKHDKSQLVRLERDERFGINEIGQMHWQHLWRKLRRRDRWQQVTGWRAPRP